MYPEEQDFQIFEDYVFFVFLQNQKKNASSKEDFYTTDGIRTR